jgi:hypothetical protein
VNRESSRGHGRSSRRIAAIGAPLGLVLIVIGVMSSAADHDGPHVDLLARTTFADDVAVQLQVTLDGQATRVIDLADASDAVAAMITIPDGVQAPWHTHAGPALLLNAGPGTLTSVIADECVLREYPAGAAYIDPGEGSLHSAINESGEDVVLYAIFLGVEDGPVIPADPPADCDLLP